MGVVQKIFGSYSKKELKRIEPIRDQVLALEDEYRALSDEELQAKTQEFKDRLADGATLDDILPDALAACREAADRVLGKRPFPVQIIGAIVLHQGRIAEMKTGEGKTLVACLSAYLNALEGKGAHIVTVNDYLAKFQSEEMGKVFRFMGMTIGVVLHDMDNAQRRAAYNCDVTYATNNELGFDYLRDNMVIYKEEKVQRGHHFAIVDEVDSILIDEARTPLIISGPGDKSSELYKVVDRFAKTLTMEKVRELDSKEDNDAKYDADYIVDEKARTATLTPQGVKKAEKAFNVQNLMDNENMTLLHHINQAIKANGIMRRDIDYVVKDGEVVIVDEFTGRLMMGRRYNEGLHQAIEAKENVKVARESRTVATITFQNYFRLYKKLSGMTGTAMTEEGEFRDIYGLDVIEVPTNRPMIRNDLNDVVYKTEQGKFRAVIDQIVACHEKGQPVLVGTISIEKSELLSAMLKKRGIPHEVLNAKYHAKEAQIVAQAGKYGAVTIATNMAGRGTDIILGGNPEYLAMADLQKQGIDEHVIAEAMGYGETDNEEILAARAQFHELKDKYKKTTDVDAERVKEAGGLFILGTERHESRRIDNQLRGRSGRQGDVGESRFFLSLEDDLMRLFGGERLQAMMDRINVDEDTPIEQKILTRSIESAQKKIEGRNFATRKNVLQFDDVMNKQREIIYTQRDKVLDGENLRDYIINMLKDHVSDVVNEYIPEDVAHSEWNIVGLKDALNIYILDEDDLLYTQQELEDLQKKDLIATLQEKALARYEQQEQTLGEKIMREMERVVLLRVVDMKWIDHIDAMEELKRGIYLRAYGQKDPVVEYRLEGFDMFDAMVASIREDTVKLLLTAKLKTDEEPKREQVAKPVSTNFAGEESEKAPVKVGKKVGRNDPCPCGSGKKYKKCCGANES